MGDGQSLLAGLWRPGVTLVVVGLVLGAATWALRRASRTPGERGEHELLLRALVFLLWIVGAVALIVSFPMSDALRSEVIGVAGLVISGSIALSATTILGNALAGIALRATRSFGVGDFIEVEGRVGRVSGLGLLHVEIQSEDRALTTLPNLFVATHPVRVTPPTGAPISVEVSLGYDVPRADVEEALLEAAEVAGLNESFVLVVGLGDFSVTYRVGGLLVDSARLVSTHSALRVATMDALHGRRVEIVSPSFMNQRQVGSRVFIPRRAAPRPPMASSDEAPPPDEVMFDKAEEAVEAEKAKEAGARGDDEATTAEETAGPDEAPGDGDRRSDGTPGV